MAHEGEFFEASLLPPVFQAVDEEGFGFPDFSETLGGMDLEVGTGGTSHAEHVESVERPSRAFGQGVKVLVEEAEAGAVAVEDDEIVLGLGRGTGDGELVEVLLGVGEMDFGGGADAVVGGLERRGGVVGLVRLGPDGRFEGVGVEGDELEDGSFGGGRGDASPLQKS